jgi:hypothetical protein
MTVIHFPIHPVRVVRDTSGCWLVLWRSWAWSYATRDAALFSAHAIASVHAVRVIIDSSVVNEGTA